MKKAKRLLKNVAVVTLVPSILLPSCSEYFINDDITHINENMNDNQNGAVAIELKLTSDERKLLDFITNLARDIVDNPVIAQQFAKSPEDFAKIYGVEDLQLNFDDAIWKLILALGDEDIHTAVKENNTSLFLSLCDEKGLISALSDSDLSVFHDILNKNPELIKTRSSLVLVLAAGIAVVGAGVAGVAIVAGAAASLAAAIHDTVTFWDGSESRSAAQVMNNRAPQAYQVWVLKNKDKDTYVMLSEYQDKLVDECIDALQERFPDEMQTVDLNELRQVIAINLPK